MLQIYCPYCQELRAEEEFACHGEAHLTRPADPDSLSDEAWGDYLFFRKNPKGLHHEMWYHAAGCRRYLNVTRDTVSYAIVETYPIGSAPRITAAEAGAP